MVLRARIHGRVQGVGFRYATQHKAQQLGLTGWVCNAPDGSVEAEFVGDQSALEAMAEWCKRGPALARVSGVDAEWADETPDYPSFTVRA